MRRERGLRASRSMRDTAKHLRRRMTEAERRLWGYLRADQLGHHFRRQHPLRFCVLDFYCARCRVAVEVDGGVHRLRAEADAQRDDELAKRGIRVVRVTNQEVLESPGEAIRRIQLACDEAARQAQPPRGAGPALTPPP
mgnify:FL=1